MIAVSLFGIRLGIKCKDCGSTLITDSLDDLSEFLLRKTCSICGALNIRTKLYAEAIEALLTDFERFLCEIEKLTNNFPLDDHFLCGNVRAAVCFHGENFCIDRFTGAIADCLSCRKHGKTMFIYFPFDYLWRTEIIPSCPRCGAVFETLNEAFALLRNLFKDFRKLSPLLREQTLIPTLVPDPRKSIHLRAFYQGCPNYPFHKKK